MDKGVKAPATIWVVGNDPVKVRLGQAILSTDGYSLETMDAATAKRRLGDGERPEGIVQFTSILLRPRRFADPEDWLRGHCQMGSQTWPWYFVVSPLAPEHLEATGEGEWGYFIGWDMFLHEPLNPVELKYFVRRLAASQPAR